MVQLVVSIELKAFLIDGHLVFCRRTPTRLVKISFR
jgi:hypothetical protein